MELYEWTKHLIKFKDCIRKKIKKLVLEEDIIIAKEQQEDKVYLIAENLIKSIPLLKKKYTTIIVCLNTKKNIDTIIANWGKLVKYNKLTIIFAQPITNEKWSIHPHTHQRISEKISEGIYTLYDSIGHAD